MRTRRQGSLLDVVTAVVLGGVGIFGGTGSMPGVLLALILVAEVRSGMQLANLSGQLQNIVIGVLLLAAIVAGNLIAAAQDRESAREAPPAPKGGEGERSSRHASHRRLQPLVRKAR